MTLPYGRATRGERVIDERPVSPGETVNIVAVLTDHGLDALWCYQDSLTAERFVAYLDVSVLPLLLAGKTLILDRHPVHRARAVRAFLDHHEVRYVYLPPYSPELNPSEEAWSKVKHVVKREKPRTVDYLFETLHHAAQSITSSDAQGYFQHVEDFSLVTV
jgi:transposase